MFQHLLVPLDGSHLAENALTAALNLAGPLGSRITLLRVIRPPRSTLTNGDSGAYADLSIKLRAQAEEEAAAYLKAHQGSLRQQGYVVHTHLVYGEPVASMILEAVQGLNADTIVMSTHGRGGLSRMVYGSVADRVLHGAHVPVVLIRGQEVIRDWQIPSQPEALTY